MLIIDGFLLSLLIKSGLTWVGLAWFVASASLQMTRWRLARVELSRTTPRDPDEVFRSLDRLFIALGALRACLIPFLFYRPIGEEHYLFTMVYSGLGAGAAFAVCGMLATFQRWAIIVGGTTAMGWAVQGTYESISVGVLLLLLFGLLAAFVYDQGRSLEQRERLAESLRAERDRTQAASDSKTRFFAAASHDLRQPLHALSINATTLEVLAGRRLDGIMRDLSLSISRALRQSNSLLDSLLDISLLEANVVKIQLEPVHALGLMRALCEEFLPTAEQRGIQLSVESNARDDSDVWIYTDPRQMRRVLANLISNALKFTESGTVQLSLRRLPPPAAGGHGSVLLSVTDTGPGIPVEEHERVFEDFYQVGNRSRDRSQGLGLGLSIVKRTAALLDVGVSLHSAMGIGTRFDLLVSMCDPPPGAGEAADPGESDPSLGEPIEPNARVLAVDDEPDILDSLATMLPHFGCEVRGAAGLAEALAVLDTGFVPQVLLVDHRLKGESGADVVRALRQRLGEVPAVIVTGDTSPNDLQVVGTAATTVVHKPIDGRLLARALADALVSPAA